MSTSKTPEQKQFENMIETTGEAKILFNLLMNRNFKDSCLSAIDLFRLGYTRKEIDMFLKHVMTLAN